MKCNNLKQLDRVSWRWSITHFDAPDVCGYVTKSSYSAVLDFRGIHFINYKMWCVCVCGGGIHPRAVDDWVAPDHPPVGGHPQGPGFPGLSCHVPEGDNRGLFWAWTVFWTSLRPLCLQGSFLTQISGFLCFIGVILCFLPSSACLLLFPEYFLPCRCLVVSPWSLLMIKMWFRWIFPFPVCVRCCLLVLFSYASQGVFAIIDHVRIRLPHWFTSWVQHWQIHLGVTAAGDFTEK